MAYLDKMRKYEALEGIRNSSLKHIEVSPYQYQYMMRCPIPPTEAMEFGTMVHTMLLDGRDHFNSQYFVLDLSKRPNPDSDFRSTENKAWKADKMAEAGSRLLISLEDYEALNKIIANVKRCRLAVELLSTPAECKEVIAQWTDAETGEKCKGLLDIKEGDRIGDVKTMRSITPRDVEREVLKYAYHNAAAYYLDGSESKSFWFILIQNQAPFDVAVRVLSPDFVAIGRAKYKANLRTLKECREKYGHELDESVTWPGHFAEGAQFLSIEPPSYLVNHG